MQPKLKTPPPLTSGAFGAVARGEAEIGVTAAALIPGTDLIPFPVELQLYQVFAAGVGTAAKEPDAAKALVKFLASEAAGPVIKANGMDVAKPH